jgi:three-Cys-motif partner protein
MKKKRKQSKKFYAQQTAQSRVKAEIITKYAASRATIITGAGVPKVVHIDLWAGRGRYHNGPESTPLMVLRNAIADPVVRRSLVTIFNDKDHADALRAEIKALPGIDTLVYEPEVLDMAMGAGTSELFQKITLAPTLAFLDPWGYVGLTRELVRSLLKDWGCEVMFFFNFNRVNMDITNETVTNHMGALFGTERLAVLRAVVAELEGEARERAVMAALFEMVREVGGQFTVPFRFVKDGSTRTSHYLIFVSKKFLGYKIMRDVMAKASSYHAPDGVASFEFNTMPSLFIPDGRGVEALVESLTVDLAATTMTVEQVFENHSAGKLYVMPNYREALLRLEATGSVAMSPPAPERRLYKGRPSLREDVRVTFPRLPGTGAKAPASRSTLGRPASDHQLSAVRRPTA